MRIIKTKLKLSFGALTAVRSPKLSKQLKGQKLKFNAFVMKVFEVNRSSINDLYLAGLITYPYAILLRKRLMKQITAHLIEMNKIK